MSEAACPELLIAPLPATEIFSFTLRLVANDSAILRAVTRSLLVRTLPVSEMLSSETMASMLLPLKAGSLRKAVASFWRNSAVVGPKRFRSGTNGVPFGSASASGIAGVAEEVVVAEVAPSVLAVVVSVAASAEADSGFALIFVPVVPFKTPSFFGKGVTGVVACFASVLRLDDAAVLLWLPWGETWSDWTCAKQVTAAKPATKLDAFKSPAILVNFTKK